MSDEPTTKILARISEKILDQLLGNSLFVEFITTLAKWGIALAMVEGMLWIVGLYEFRKDAGVFFFFLMAWHVLCRNLLSELIECVDWVRVWKWGMVLYLLIGVIWDAYLIFSGAYSPILK